MKLSHLCSWTLAAAVGVGTAARAADWSNWRGPQYNGATTETGLPVEFSPTKNVKWATALPGPSAATPAIWGNRVYVSSTDTKTGSLLALCLERQSGKVLWSHNVGSGYKPAGKGEATYLDPRSNYASPSPVTDGGRVFFFYGNGDLVALTPSGERLWSRNLQKENGDFNFGWTFSSSPVLWDGRLYVQILQRDVPVSGRGRNQADSYLMALSPSTGKELWRASRPTPARMESREAFTTPMPYVHKGQKLILLAGGDLVSGHEAATGKELWRWGTWNEGHRTPHYRLVPSPVAGAGVVLGCGPKNEPVFAIKLGMSGDLGDAGVAWQSERRGTITTDVPTPLFYNNRFYVVSDLKRNITCLDPATGKALWATPLILPSNRVCWASPTAADGKIYVVSLRGEVVVVDADSGKILATNPMAEDEDEIRSSVAISRGNLFVRTNSHLYSIGK